MLLTDDVDQLVVQVVGDQGLLQLGEEALEGTGQSFHLDTVGVLQHGGDVTQDEEGLQQLRHLLGPSRFAVGAL